MGSVDFYRFLLLSLFFTSCKGFPQFTSISPAYVGFEPSGDAVSISSKESPSLEVTANLPPTPTTAIKGVNHQSVVWPRIPIAQPNFPRVAIPFVIAGWVFSACLVKIILNGFPRMVSAVPESCWLIVAGFLVGSLLYWSDIKMLSPLSSTIFFFCMLPPIILDAGYFMPNRKFFDHLGTILLFAVVGTFFNAITIGLSLWACGLTGIYGFEISLLEVLIFSSLISAVDPVAVLAVFEEIHVDQVLYIIVFGESLLNDAVTVVLYNMFDSYLTLGPENIEVVDIMSGFVSFVVVAVGGSAIGVLWGFMTGFVTRFTHRVLLIEPAFVFIMSYFAYLCAEAFQMSGILSIMFCGITMKNYVAENVSPKSLTTVKCGLKMFSHCSEAIIFMFLGVNTVNDQHEWNTPFILLTIFFCSIYRALGVIILTELANYFRLHQLSRVEQFVMSYGGLRGAIAFALVLLVDPTRIPRQPLFVTATISVVFFTVFVQGITIKPLVEFLQIKRAEKRAKTMNERVHEKLIDYTMAGVEDILGQRSSYTFRDRFKHFDFAHIRPYLVREKGTAHGHEPKILETYSKLTMKDAVNFARRNPSGWLIGGDTSQREDGGPVYRRNETSSTVRTNESGLFMEVIDPAGYHMIERQYNPCEKDIHDAELHHILSDAIWKPHRKYHDRSSHHHQHRRSKHYSYACDASCSLYAHKSRTSYGGMTSPSHLSSQLKPHDESLQSGSLREHSNGVSVHRSNSVDPVIEIESEKGISFIAAPNIEQRRPNEEVELPFPWKSGPNEVATELDQHYQLEFDTDSSLPLESLDKV